MFFVGIDIAKKTHQAAITSDDGKLIGKAFKTVSICFWKNSVPSTLNFHSSKSAWKLQAITG